MPAHRHAHAPPAAALRQMTLADYDAVHALLRATPGVVVRMPDDSREALAVYLERNPGLSFVAEMDGRIIGCVMCGHDGRRGYLQHLAVASGFRRQGIGSRLVHACLDKLRESGITKTHIFVLADNRDGLRFWEGGGWIRRNDIVLLSYHRKADAAKPPR